MRVPGDVKVLPWLHVRWVLHPANTRGVKTQARCVPHCAAQGADAPTHARTQPAPSNPSPAPLLPCFVGRGSEGKVAEFSASISKVQLLKDAIEKHSAPRCSLGTEPGPEGLATGAEREPAAAP